MAGVFGLVQSAVLIFILRVGDVSLATVRVLMVVRGRKALAWVLGFGQALVFVVALRAVLSDLGNWLNILGYAAGFATGNVVGMMIEERIALGHSHLRIISSGRGAEVAEHLRGAGYAVTEISGRGKDGTVTLLNCSVLRRRVMEVKDLVEEIDRQAMVTAEDIHPVRRGFWRA
ncbi:MAG TPA: DUF5698 domain-containing protein [Anaerolineales bacterium]|jgi:uncharacterized protein YebE (UPF0316 family)|nr:DUF5698 domain-containing protein [Anaerolineales bacterium]